MAALVLSLGVLPLRAAAEEARGLGPTIGFLTAVLLLAHMAGRFGLFESAGLWMAARATAQWRCWHSCSSWGRR